VVSSVVLLLPFDLNNTVKSVREIELISMVLWSMMISPYVFQTQISLNTSPHADSIHAHHYLLFCRELLAQLGVFLHLLSQGVYQRFALRHHTAFLICTCGRESVHVRES
jgi:hypothetical protein